MKKIIFTGIFILALHSVKLQAQTDALKAKELVQKGYDSFKKGQYQEAILFFEKSHQFLKHPVRYQNIARCYEMLADYPRAITYFSRYGAAAPEIKEARETEQKLLSLLSKYMEAKTAISDKDLQWLLSQTVAAGRLQLLPSLYIIAGLTHFKHFAWEKAIRYFEEARTQESIRNNRPIYLLVSGYIESAKRHRVEYEKFKPILDKGDGLVAQKAYKDAIAVYKTALEPKPPLYIKELVLQKIKAAETLIEKDPGKKMAPVGKIDPKRKIAGWILFPLGLIGLAMTGVVIYLVVDGKGVIGEEPIKYGVPTLVSLGTVSIALVSIGLALALHKEELKFTSFQTRGLSILPTLNPRGKLDGATLHFTQIF